MHFSTTIAAISALTGLTLAAPALKSRGEGTTFALLAVVDGSTDGTQVTELSNGQRWAVYRNEQGHAALTSDLTKQAIFYEFQHEDQPTVAWENYGMVVTPGGTATVPSTNTVDLDEVISGAGTKGVAVDTDSLLQYDGGKWMACRASDSDDIVLSFQSEGQRRLAVCANVQLISNCRSGDPVGQLGTPETVQCRPH